MAQKQTPQPAPSPTVHKAGSPPFLYERPLQEGLRSRLLDYAKPRSGPWRAEFTRSLSRSHSESAAIAQDTRRPVISGDPSTGLLERIERAAGSLGLSVGGFYWMGIPQIPDSSMLPQHCSEALLLSDSEGRFTPLIVSPERMLLRCGALPFLFPYDGRTDLGEIFRNALVSESFL